MKKKLPIILLLVCTGLLIAGAVGLTCRRGARGEDMRGGEGAGEISPESGLAAQSERLLRVVAPDSLTSQIKEYEGFTLSFNAVNGTPNWVAWELLGTETDGGVSRSNKFWQDAEVRGCPQHQDYSGSGYDRGHMCPAADQKWSEQAMNDCFSLTNVAPQHHALNTGAWKTLENKERLWARRDSAIIIVAGPVYAPSDTERIGEAGVRVPGAFFKVIAAPYLAEPRGIAFVYPNMPAPGNMQNYVMTIRDVEKLTGFDFFSELPDHIEERVESVASFRDWNKR